MAYCPTCGQPVREGAKFCDSCGNAIQAASTASSPAIQTTSPQLQPLTAPSKKKSRMSLYAVVGIIVVVVLVLGGMIIGLGLLNNSGSNNSSPTTPPPTNNPTPPPPPATVAIASQGTVWNLNAGYYESIGPVDLTSNSTWTISGTFTASNGIDAYVMTSSEYSSWGGSGSPTGYYWTSGSGVTSGSVNTNLPNGIYYFVFENTNLITSTSVDVTTTIIATASG